MALAVGLSAESTAAEAKKTALIIVWFGFLI